jgi:predicted DCC family thiol-disulfide oxidoreductase YuxK
MAISVSTEITEENVAGRRGWVLYDGDCQFCIGWVRRMKPILVPRGFGFLPLQTPWVRAFFDLPEAELLSKMRVVFNKFDDFNDGNNRYSECIRQAFGGADAIVELAKHVWWAWPLVAVAQIPIARNFMRARYRATAARRYCVNGTCAVPRPENPQSGIAPEGGIRI